MNFRRLPLLFSLALIALALPARAQFVGERLGIYGTITAQQLSTNGTSVEPVGGFGGVYYNFMTLGHVQLGADLRAGTTHTKQGAEQGFNNVGTRVNMALGGIRAGIPTPIYWIKPYAQGSVGWGSSNFGQGTTTPQNGLNIQVDKLTNGLAYSGFAGVDLRVLPVMDVRLIEFGIGSLQGNGSSHTLKSVSAGVVFHLP